MVKKFSQQFFDNPREKWSYFLGAPSGIHSRYCSYFCLTISSVIPDRILSGLCLEICYKELPKSFFSALEKILTTISFRIASKMYLKFFWKKILQGVAPGLQTDCFANSVRNTSKILVEKIAVTFSRFSWNLCTLFLQRFSKKVYAIHSSREFSWNFYW